MPHYRIQIDVSALADDHDDPSSDWQRWCEERTPEGEDVPADPRIVSLGGADAGIDYWTVRAENEDEARDVVAKYAQAVGVDVGVLGVDAA